MENNALIKALQTKKENENTGAYSKRELIKATGMSEHSVSNMLHELMEDGRLEVVKEARKTMVGHSQKIPCYKIKEGGD